MEYVMYFWPDYRHSLLASLFTMLHSLDRVSKTRCSLYLCCSPYLDNWCSSSCRILLYSELFMKYAKGLQRPTLGRHLCCRILSQNCPGKHLWRWLCTFAGTSKSSVYPSGHHNRKCWFLHSPVGLYRNAEPTNAVHERGVLFFLLILVFLLFTSSFAHMVIAAVETAEEGGSKFMPPFTLIFILTNI